MKLKYVKFIESLLHILKQYKVVRDRSIGELKSVEIGMDPSQNTDILVATNLSNRNYTIIVRSHIYKNIQIKFILFKN